MKKVLYSKEFRYGNSQSEFFKDFNHLNAKQDILLMDFIDAFLDKTPLCGSNKKNNYSTPNLFHYHIGYKYYNNPNPFCKHLNCYDLVENRNGQESAGVLYYLRKDSDTIIILAFGEKHIPFPKEYEPTNILIKRALGDIVDKL